MLLRIQKLEIGFVNQASYMMVTTSHSMVTIVRQTTISCKL